VFFSRLIIPAERLRRFHSSKYLWCTLLLVPSMDKWSPDEPCFRTPPKIKEAAGPAPVGCRLAVRRNQQHCSRLSRAAGTCGLTAATGGASRAAGRSIRGGGGRNANERAACVRVRWKCNVTAAEKQAAHMPDAGAWGQQRTTRRTRTRPHSLGGAGAWRATHAGNWAKISAKPAGGPAADALISNLAASHRARRSFSPVVAGGKTRARGQNWIGICRGFALELGG
jgi:hypothetical protein